MTNEEQEQVRIDIIAFVGAVIDCDGWLEGQRQADDRLAFDAIDVSAIVDAIARTDRYRLGENDPIVRWAREVFEPEYFNRVFEVSETNEG